MIDFDTIEEKLTFDQQDLFFNEKELAKITNVLRQAFIWTCFRSHFFVT